MHRIQTCRGVAALALATAFAAPLAARDGAHDHGDHRHPVTTTSHEAQRLFDEGLHLAWGFNHLEAARAFRAAIAADSECAMCHWGLALVLGPNINAAADPQYHDEIVEALGKAQQLASRGTERERAYIDALNKRYGPEPVADRSQLDRAYANEMRRVARRFPDDLDAGVLFAEAIMDTMPWDYWTADGEPKPATREFIDVLESVLRRDPKHPGGNHLLIHAVEKVRPDLGVPAAERLDQNPQATGHLVHMASHIYIRVGRYADAVRVNERGIAEDQAYARTHEVPAEYQGYMLHNHHMLWAAAAFEGNSERALEAARYVKTHTPAELLTDPAGGGGMQMYASFLYQHLVRFGRWDEILAEPRPETETAYPHALWHYARGRAFVARGELDAAQAELAAMKARLADPSIEPYLIWGLNPNRSVGLIGQHVLEGELAAARGDWSAAIRNLEEAVRREDALTYDEPPPWSYPARHSLGAVLLLAGRAAEAERVFRADLDIFPRNGWSLFGLAQALEARSEKSEAEKVRAELTEAWQNADVELVAARY
jgi:tetratricopeptide (TPR) repeat protein